MKRLFGHVLIGLCIASAAIAVEPATLPEGIIRLEPYPAPRLELEDLDGVAYDIEEDRGSVVFVHFWASWCGPCREEMPAVQRMWNELEKEGLKIALINTAEDEDTLFSFLAAHAPDIRPLTDADGQVTEAWKPRGLPATYLVDKQGQVRYQALGGRPWDQSAYMQFLRTLLLEKHP